MNLYYANITYIYLLYMVSFILHKYMLQNTLSLTIHMY